MSRKLMLFLLAVILVSSNVSHASPVEITRSVTWRDSGLRSDVDLSLRLIGGKGSVFGQGRDINLTFQTDRDAYVIIYNIDSEGVVQLLYPADGVPRMARKGKVYFLPEQGKGIKWEVAGKTGIEYIQALAVEDEGRIDLEELRFLAENYDASADRQLRVDMDPLLAFNLLNEDIVRDSDEVPIATDFTYFYINREVGYPRYLCDKCHGAGDLADPYAMDCSEIYIEEMLHDEDDLHYPYPAQFAVKHFDEEEGGYYVSTDYADKVTSDWDDEEYYDDADSKVYLSIYYTDYDYPYRFDYPGWRSWYYTTYDPWYWNYGPYDWGYSFTWQWGDYYYHHWPFHSYYAHNYYAYNWGCVYGWHPYYYHWNYHDYWYGGNYHYAHNDYNRRGMYAGRNFKKRSLDYTVASTKTARDRSIKKSRLADARAKDLKRRVDPASVRDGSYSRGGNVGTGRTGRLTDTAGSSVVRSRVIYDGTGRKTGTSTGSRYRKDPASPRKDNVGRSMDRDSRDRTGTTTRGRTWGRKSSDDRKSDRETRSSEKSSRTRRSKSTERSSTTGKSTSTRKNVPIRTRRSSSETPRKSSPAKSSTRKSSSGSKKSPSSTSKSSSRKSTSTRSSSSSRRSTPAKSSSSGSSRSSSRSSSGSSKSSSKSSKGRRR